MAKKPPAPIQRQKAANKELSKKLKKVGPLPSYVLGRAKPKAPNTSEFGYLKSTFLKESGLQSLGNALGRIQNKANKKKK